MEYLALDLDLEGKEVMLSLDAEAPLVALAFKLEVTPYGQLTYLRVYQGFVAKGTDLVNSRNKKRVRVGRLVRMHAAEMEDLDDATLLEVMLKTRACLSSCVSTADCPRKSCFSTWTPVPSTAYVRGQQ